MALQLTRQVKWHVYRIDSCGSVGNRLGDFTFDDDEKKAQAWANQNKKSLWSVNKKTKVKVFRSPH